MAETLGEPNSFVVESAMATDSNVGKNLNVCKCYNDVLELGMIHSNLGA